MEIVATLILLICSALIATAFVAFAVSLNNSMIDDRYVKKILGENNSLSP